MNSNVFPTKLCTPNLQILFLCELDLKEVPKRYSKGTPNLKVLDLSDNKYLQFFTLTNLGFALLCIASNDQLSLIFLFFVWFPIIHHYLCQFQT
jgi:hypothetical protein